jgi:2-polyprenyl-3-methyl-5-hydroxy-6-metoxy-1,4-benzoquinol methylase
MTADALISPDARDANRALHAEDDGYGNGGARHLQAVAAYADALQAWSILDYGCGRGALRRALLRAGYAKRRLREYDPAIAKKAALPKPADLVVCTDVLEHVEPEYLPTVLAHLRQVGLYGGYLAIATRPSNKTLPDGRNAHLVVQPGSWWAKQLRQVGWRVLRLEHIRRKHWQPGDPDRAVLLWLR